MPIYKNLAKILEEASNIKYLPSPEVNFHNDELMVGSGIDLVWRINKGQLIIDLKKDLNIYQYLINYYSIGETKGSYTIFEFTMDDLSQLMEDLKSII